MTAASSSDHPETCSCGIIHADGLALKVSSPTSASPVLFCGGTAVAEHSFATSALPSLIAQLQKAQQVVAMLAMARPATDLFPSEPVTLQ